MSVVTAKAADRVQRIWRREGLKVPQKQPKRGRLWLTDGSCVRLRPAHRNHVWSFDFVETQTHDGRRLRLMTLIDEFTRKCLAIRVARRINAIGVIETLVDAMLFEGTPLLSWIASGGRADKEQHAALMQTESGFSVERVA